MSLGRILLALVVTACALGTSVRSYASGVPIGGFLPMLGISLTDEYKDENNDTFYFADPEPQLVGTQLGPGSAAHYDIALLDTGAAVSLLTAASDAAFNIQTEGFRGTETLTIGGATGFLEATINDPLGMFVTGLANRTSASGAPLALDNASFIGQSSVSMLTIPEESDLPNVIGIPFASQLATYIRSDQPQIFELNGNTVRTPQIEFLPLGSGGQGITRRAPMQLESSAAFQSPPLYIFNFANILSGEPLTENPQAPTVLQEPGAMFLNVNVNNEGESLSNFEFFFDTGADVTVVSELNAVRLGFDPVLDEPEFTVAVVGSGGVNLEVPGFFVDQFTIQAVGGSHTLSNVPVIVLDVTNPADPGNVVDGIVGTNLLAGRNVVIDPNPSLGGGVGPSLYISDPVTSQKNWTAASPTGTWSTGDNWSSGSAPDTLSIANVRHVNGGDQTAVVAANATVWELNVSGTLSQTIAVEVRNGITLTTFSGINIEQGGVVDLKSGTLDAQFVEILGGTLRGEGVIKTGSGPIPGQVENRDGRVAVGDGVGTLEIFGRFANGFDGTVAFDIGGLTAGTQHDKLIVEGGVALDGTLAVSLVNLGSSFTPVAGNSFTLITATDGLSGEFETLDLPGGFNWSVLYDTDRVELLVGLSGDFNDDGTVDAADYSLWRDTLGATGSGLAADGDGDGVVDTDDYAVWKNNFGMTLGAGTGVAAAVPEPATFAPLLLAALPLIRRARSARSKNCGSFCSS